MTDAWSITDGYHDVGGTWHPTPEDTRRALREAMGGDELDAPLPPPPMRFVRAGTEAPAGSAGEIRLEDGTVVTLAGTLPPDLPLGYHELTTDHDATTVVVTPGACPAFRRAWGWAVQLYSVRSSRSWGIGDLGDLGELARWSARAGAGVILTNPLHADVPVAPQQPSPYFATSRVWRNVTALRIEDVPGADRIAPLLAPLAERGRALNAEPLLDRDAVLAVKRPALEALFAAFDERGGDPDFDDWCATRSVRLDHFAVFCSIADEHGRDFSRWPAELRHPGTVAVAAYAAGHRDRVRFHAWCQWQIERQLDAAARAGVAVIGDLAVGFEPHGADAWSYQEDLAVDCRVGAPPDSFNEKGQDWGLPPFVPWKLRAGRYEPFITTVRAALAGCGGLRIDHVMVCSACTGSRPAPGLTTARTFATRTAICSTSSPSKRTVPVRS